MTVAAHPTAEERTLLQASVRGYLALHWPIHSAVAGHRDTAALTAIWTGLAAQGLTTLGSDAEAGGASELMVVMAELGRAACPIPLMDAALVNLALLGADEPAANTLRDALHSGAARVVFGVAPFDAASHEISAELPAADAGVAATHAVILHPTNAQLAVVALNAGAPRCTVAAYRALGLDCCAKVSLQRASSSIVPLKSLLVADLQRLRNLSLLARAVGAARRAFELVVDYAKERHQFGKPIGSFQAIAHKLANCHIALEGVRLTLHNAALQHDLGHADWRYFAAAACAFGGSALRQVALETQHAFGAIGYAEEHEAPRHFRRVHLDTVALGAAQAELAAHWCDGRFDEARDLPRYDLGAAGNALRGEVRAWLAQHWSGARKAAFDAKPFHEREFDASFALDMGKTGWIGLIWPSEFGGQARSPIEQIAFMEEMERAEAPRVGAAIQATALMLHGTPAQQQRYLPDILRGTAMHGMGYSEPNAGSDLAALKTTAVRDGDAWVINGQKMWTTTWWGNYMFLAARTNPSTKPAHAGISMFIVPMTTPGIDVKPANTMYDGSFANIFYDDVRVPADSLLGEVDGGWKVLTSALATERGLVGGGIVLKVAHAFGLLCAELRACGMCADPLIRARIAQLAAEIEVGRQLMMHCADLAGAGETPPAVGAMSKVFSGELMERFGVAALELLGLPGTFSQGTPGAVLQGRFEQMLRHSLMWVISIGTNEIQRTLIAQRGLGLPK